MFGIALQGAGFSIAFGWRRSPLSTLLAGSLEEQWVVAGLSVALALASAAFLVAAVRTLGKQWSLLPRLIQEHDLIQKGPYSIVRHPIYTSMLGVLVATGVAFTTIGGLVVAVVLYAMGTALRIRIEERLLRSMFGEAYAAYAQRVPALLPFRLARTA